MPPTASTFAPAIQGPLHFEPRQWGAGADDRRGLDAQLAQRLAVPALIEQQLAGVVALSPDQSKLTCDVSGETSRVSGRTLECDSLTSLIGVEVIRQRPGDVVFARPCDQRYAITL